MRRLAVLALLLPMAPLPGPGALPPPVLDIAYGSYDPSLLLDWYPPAPVKGPHAALIFIHGGAPPVGDKIQVVQDDAELLGLLRLNGIGVASVNYRPYPQFIYPDQFHDVQLAVQYVRANAASFGIDPARVGVWGHSSGALLGGWLCYDADAAQPGGSIVEQQSSRPVLLLNDAAITDFNLLVPWFDGDFFGKTYLGQVDPAVLDAASLDWELCHVSRPFTPPVYCLYGMTFNRPPLTDPHDAWFMKVMQETMRTCTPQAEALSVFTIRDAPLDQIIAPELAWFCKRFDLPAPVVWPLHK